MLPKISTPLIPIESPTRPNEKIIIRQFLTKEYKAIMSAANTNNAGIFTATTGKVIESCVVEPENFSISDYTMFEVDYLFLQIYAASIDGTLKVSLTCNNMVDKPEVELNEMGFEQPTGKTVKQPCGTEFMMPIPIHEVKISDMSDGVIKLDGNIIIKLRYPKWRDWRETIETLNDRIDLRKSENLPEEEQRKLEEESRTDVLKIIYNCIDSIWVGDDKWEESFTEEDFIEWVDSFTAEASTRLMNFISNAPQITFTKEVQCPMCGKQELITLVSLDAFLK